MQTPERFRSLAEMLLGDGEAQDGIALRTAQHGEGAVQVEESAAQDDTLELMREVRLFYARVVEAVEAAVETLVADIAVDVLGRELLLAPCDIEAIVDRALARFTSEQPLRVRVHPDDAVLLQCAVPVVADERLRAGDAVVELREGSVDASLGVRLAALVRAGH